jgi:hypothetical protein
LLIFNENTHKNTQKHTQSKAREAKGGIPRVST